VNSFWTTCFGSKRLTFLTRGIHRVMASTSDYETGDRVRYPARFAFFFFFCLAPFTLYQKPAIDHCPCNSPPNTPGLTPANHCRRKACITTNISIVHLVEFSCVKYSTVHYGRTIHVLYRVIKNMFSPRPLGQGLHTFLSNFSLVVSVVNQSINHCFHSSLNQN
jgi:hypothetical protein